MEVKIGSMILTLIIVYSILQLMHHYRVRSNFRLGFIAMTLLIHSSYEKLYKFAKLKLPVEILQAIENQDTHRTNNNSGDEYQAVR